MTGTITTKISVTIGPAYCVFFQRYRERNKMGQILFMYEMHVNDERRI